MQMAAFVVAKAPNGRPSRGLRRAGGIVGPPTKGPDMQPLAMSDTQARDLATEALGGLGRSDDDVARLAETIRTASDRHGHLCYFESCSPSTRTLDVAVELGHRIARRRQRRPLSPTPRGGTVAELSTNDRKDLTWHHASRPDVEGRRHPCGAR